MAAVFIPKTIFAGIRHSLNSILLELFIFYLYNNPLSKAI